MTTGDRIRQARKAAGMTQGQLADKIGVKYSAIHKYETGLVVNLKRETIAALADALDVKPSWLMCLDDEDLTDLSRLSDDEQHFILLYRKADEIDKGTIRNILSRYDEVESSILETAG